MPPSGLRLDGVAHAGRFRLTAALTADAEETVAVVGPNGAGKSTLLRVVAGLTRLDSGTLTLDGHPLDDPARAAFVPAGRRRVGMVFSDGRLFPGMSVLENVAFGLRARGTAAGPARLAARDWLARLGLAGLERRRPAQLSGGQAQRVALARALCADPELLLLDEPLAALDVTTRAEVQTALAEHVAGFPGPALLVTHDPLEAVLLARRLVVLERGTVVQTGSATELSRRPATAYVAALVGVNLWRGHGDGTTTVALVGGGRLVVPAPVNGDVFVVASPAALSLHPEDPEDPEDPGRPDHPGTGWWARVEALAVVGDAASGAVRVRLAGPPAAAVDVDPAASARLGVAPGRTVWVTVPAAALTVYPAPPNPHDASPVTP